jgi:hypothetical protein
MSSFYQKNLIGLLYYDPIANVCISYDPTLFYSVSFYSVSFSCTAQIHKLKFKSEYYNKFLHGVNPVGDNCMDLQPYSHDPFSKISRAFFASRK